MHDLDRAGGRQDHVLCDSPKYEAVVQFLVTLGRVEAPVLHLRASSAKRMYDLNTRPDQGSGPVFQADQCGVEFKAKTEAQKIPDRDFYVKLAVLKRS
jgi:hypothetical protein